MGRCGAGFRTASAAAWQPVMEVREREKRGQPADFHAPLVLKTKQFGERKSVAVPHFRPNTLLPRAANTATGALSRAQRLRLAAGFRAPVGVVGDPSVFSADAADGGVQAVKQLTGDSGGDLRAVAERSSLLYETAGADPAAYIGAAALMLAVGAVASLRPALRAARSEPLSVLGAE